AGPRRLSSLPARLPPAFSGSGRTVYVPSFGSVESFSPVALRGRSRIVVPLQSRPILNRTRARQPQTSSSLSHAPGSTPQLPGLPRRRSRLAARLEPARRRARLAQPLAPRRDALRRSAQRAVYAADALPAALSRPGHGAEQPRTLSRQP